MSYHDGTSYDYKVGIKVQEFVDEGFEEILVSKGAGGWDIIGDNRLFWTLKTPLEVEKIQQKLKLAIQALERIETVYYDIDVSDEQTLLRIDTIVEEALSRIREGE